MLIYRMANGWILSFLWDWQVPSQSNLLFQFPISCPFLIFPSLSWLSFPLPFFPLFLPPAGWHWLCPWITLIQWCMLEEGRFQILMITFCMGFVKKGLLKNRMLQWLNYIPIEGFHVTSLQQNLPSHAAHSGHVGSHKIWPNSLLLKLHKA